LKLSTAIKLINSRVINSKTNKMPEDKRTSKRDKRNKRRLKLPPPLSPLLPLLPPPKKLIKPQLPNKMLNQPPPLPPLLLLKKLSLLPLKKMLLKLPPQPPLNPLSLPHPLKPMLPRRMPRKSEEYKRSAMFLMHEI
jgi:hypothetical protein